MLTVPLEVQSVQHIAQGFEERSLWLLNYRKKMFSHGTSLRFCLYMDAAHCAFLRPQGRNYRYHQILFWMLCPPVFVGRERMFSTTQKVTDLRNEKFTFTHLIFLLFIFRATFHDSLQLSFGFYILQFFLQVYIWQLPGNILKWFFMQVIRN